MRLKPSLFDSLAPTYFSTRSETKVFIFLGICLVYNGGF